jgi:hypothetical protein
MTRSYFPRQLWALSGILVGMAFLCVSVAAAQAPSIEGTYQLTSRKLPDGTVIKPPDVMGLYTFTKTYRNFNVVQKDATSKFASFSVVSTYTLTATAYSEIRLFSIRTDQIGGKDIVYNLSSETRSAPVTVEGGRIQFKDPFGTRSQVFEGNKMTATTPEGNIDVWEKVP